MTETNEAANAQDNTNANAGEGNETNQEQTFDFGFVKDGLPDDLKQTISHETFEDLAKDYSDLKNNQPQVPESYDIVYNDADYQATVTPEQETAFQGMAKEIGLTQSQVEKLLAFDESRYQSTINSYSDAQEKMKTDAENALKTEWGNDYKKNLDVAAGAFKQFLDSTGQTEKDIPEDIRNNPDVVRMFKFWGDSIGEDGFHEGKTVKTKQAKDNYGNPMLFDPKK